MKEEVKRRIIAALVMCALTIMAVLPVAEMTNIGEEYTEINEQTDKVCYINVTVEEAKRMMDSEENVMLVDVRTPLEYESRHIAGAVSVPLADLEMRIDELYGDETKIVYCKAGGRSIKP